jgi:hypothetical protein
MAHTSNLLLASLSPSDTAALKPYLKSAHLEQERVLVEAGATIGAIYFPTSAVISIVVPLSTGELVEAAMIGRDGVMGAGAALDGKTSLSRAIVQLAGDAMMCGVDDLRSAAMQSQSLLSKLIRPEQTVTAQSQQSAACIAAHTRRSAFAAGFFGRGICPAAIRCFSRRNFLPRCWACVGPASRLSPIPCNKRA